MAEAVSREVQLVRRSGDGGKLHEVKKHLAKGSGILEECRCVLGFWGLMHFVEKVKYLTWLSNSLQFDTLIFYFTRLLKKK